MTIFQDYSYFYNIFYRDKDYRAESRYINRLLVRYQPGVRTVLDLGCGTGRHDFHLVEKGFQVVGVDRSVSMLKIAEETKERQLTPDGKINFHQADIRSFRTSQKFDAVISLFHVVSYMTGNDDVIKMFNTANKHLKTRGIFIFDLWYGPAVLYSPPETKIKNYEDITWNLKRYSRPEIRENENMVNVHYKVIAENKKTKTKKKIEEIHPMRYFFKPEIEYFLSNCGFTLLKSEEFPSGKTPGFSSWGVAFIARKK